MIQYKWIASTKQYASPEISMQEKDVFDVIFNLLSVSPRRRCLSFFFSSLRDVFSIFLLLSDCCCSCSLLSIAFLIEAFVVFMWPLWWFGVHVDVSIFVRFCTFSLFQNSNIVFFPVAQFNSRGRINRQ